MTAAEYLDLALYHPVWGYYAAAPKRSGRDGDFFTSVDVGAVFGATVARQVIEMFDRLADRGVTRFDLVEAGAGNGQLTRDILDALARDRPDLYTSTRVGLVERSRSARAAQPAVLAGHEARVAGSLEALPSPITGVVVANELLDALPVHVVATPRGELREVFVGLDVGGALAERTGPLSTAAVADYFARCGVALPPDVRAEAGLAAEGWMEAAAAALDEGFLLLFDYGHEAEALYSAAHPAGTLTTFRGHVADGCGWLQDPGTVDITADVNLTAVRNAAVRAGLTPVGAIDQAYFLLNLGIAERLPEGDDRHAIARRLAAKTLLAPGGLGSTMKAMAFATHPPGGPLTGFRSGRLT